MSVKLEKKTVPVIVLTTTYRLEGNMHVIPGGRLLDELNRQRGFIPITNATLYDPMGGEPIDTLDFIAINKDQVLMIAPVTES